MKPFSDSETKKINQNIEKHVPTAEKKTKNVIRFK